MIEVGVELKVNNETGKLRTVVVGIASDRGGDDFDNNPKYRDVVKNGNDPRNADLVAEINDLADILERYGVTVYRPSNIVGQTQIFARDIAFVIGDVLIRSRMALSTRGKEIAGVEYLFRGVEEVLSPPEGAIIEGGDVVLSDKYIFVGLGARTNQAGYQFLKENFRNKVVVPVYLNATGDPRSNVLHLDCAFQPVGDRYAIIYEDGFRERPKQLYEYFGKENLIKISATDMYEMKANIFSISKSVVVVEASFEGLIYELEKRGMKVERIRYHNVGLLGGSLRCSTLPLYRD